MSSTNKTPSLGLSQFLGSDKPNWMTDYNEDMGKIDAVRAVKDGGTGRDSLTSGRVLVGNGTGAVEFRAIAVAPEEGSDALLEAGGAYAALADKASLGGTRLLSDASVGAGESVTVPGIDKYIVFTIETVNGILIGCRQGSILVASQTHNVGSYFQTASLDATISGNVLTVNGLNYLNLRPGQPVGGLTASRIVGITGIV